MVLSLSPGPTALENAEEVGANAQMWRISEDLWDHWSKGKEWSQGVRGQFGLLASWEKYAQPGNWPDADMLPIGELEPTPGDGAPRTTIISRFPFRSPVETMQLPAALVVPVFIPSYPSVRNNWFVFRHTMFR